MIQARARTRPARLRAARACAAAAQRAPTSSSRRSAGFALPDDRRCIGGGSAPACSTPMTCASPPRDAKLASTYQLGPGKPGMAATWTPAAPGRPRPSPRTCSHRASQFTAGREAASSIRESRRAGRARRASREARALPPRRLPSLAPRDQALFAVSPLASSRTRDRPRGASRRPASPATPRRAFSRRRAPPAAPRALEPRDQSESGNPGRTAGAVADDARRLCR